MDLNPAEHVMADLHTDDPGLLYVPAGQVVQEVAGSDPYVFTGHRLQAASIVVDPVVDLETLPGGHDAQIDCPVEGLYVPGGQAIAPPPALVFGPFE